MGVQDTPPSMLTLARLEHFRQTPEANDYGFNITQPGSSNMDDQTLHELYAW